MPKNTDIQECNWKSSLLPEDATVGEAVQVLDRSKHQIVLVSSSGGVLKGTITDGDIRRGLLRGVNLNSSLQSVINSTPFVLPCGIETNQALKIMKDKGLRHIPIVDSLGMVVGVHTLKELLENSMSRPNKMIIMAGGQGIRLRPHTEHCPKPLLLVGGKPILKHIIERANAEGIENFIIATHYLGHMIEEYFSDGSSMNVSIEYLRENSPLGTAGALSMLDSQIVAPFLVTNGDVLTEIKYTELLDYHLTFDSVATMAVRLQEYQNPFGVVHVNGVDIIGFEEKPVSRNYINAGIYVLNPVVLNFLKQGEECSMPALFERLQQSGLRTIVYPMHEPWLDIGRPSDLERARVNLT